MFYEAVTCTSTIAQNLCSRVFICTIVKYRAADCSYALFMPFYYHSRCFTDVAIMRNYRDNHRLDECCYICYQSL